MKITDLKANPKNPRIIKDDKFKKLVKSLQEFPEMMAKRPMVCVTDVEIYIIGGYDRLINKLRAKFVNMVSDEKGYKGFVGKERVFILTGYVSHADISKIESLGIDGMFVNSKGINGVIMEIEGCVKG